MVFFLYDTLLVAMFFALFSSFLYSNSLHLSRGSFWNTSLPLEVVVRSAYTLPFPNLLWDFIENLMIIDMAYIHGSFTFWCPYIAPYLSFIIQIISYKINVKIFFHRSIYDLWQKQTLLNKCVLVIEGPGHVSNPKFDLSLIQRKRNWGKG